MTTFLVLALLLVYEVQVVLPVDRNGSSEQTTSSWLYQWSTVISAVAFVIMGCFLQRLTDVPTVEIKKNYTVVAGEKVKLKCCASAFPCIKSVSWKHILPKGETKQLDIDQQKYTSTKPNHIVINQTLKSDEGEYVCIVSNWFGKTQSKRTKLTVEGVKDTSQLSQPSQTRRPSTVTNTKKHFIMASNLSTEVSNLHNKMVFDISREIFGEQLEEVKDLFSNNPLSSVDISKITNIRKLFKLLMNYETIGYGKYQNFVSKISCIHPQVCSIVQKCAEEINKLQGNPDDQEEIIVTMVKDKYKKRSGSPVFLECTVKPTPESVQWKKSQETPPTPPQKIIPIDNQKYFSGSPEAPTLIIKETNENDESYYQCTAKRKRKAAVGTIVHLEVSDGDEPRIGNRNESLQPLLQSVSSAKDISTSSKYRRKSWPIIGRKPTIPNRKRVLDIPSLIFDNHDCYVMFRITNTIDVNRSASLSDIQAKVTAVIGNSERTGDVIFVQECILVRIVIKAARSPTEPSALYLAEEFKHYMLDGGVIQLSDESNTVLNVDKTSFEITPRHVPKHGHPYVSISYGELTVSESKSIFLQTYIIASPAVSAIQWFRVNDEDNLSPIEIDNKRYFGGSDLSPSLIIRNVNREDQGCYFCIATNANGIGSSNKTLIRIQTADVTAIKDIAITTAVNTSDDKGSSTAKQPKTEDQSQQQSTAGQEAMATNISNKQEVMARDIHDLKGDLAAMNVTTANTTSSHAKKIRPDLESMIETTKAKIKKEKEKKKFHPTKGFRDAKEKLLKNRVVVIKGNTGDGKTAIAVQLLHWLSREQGVGQPLQLHKIKKLDLLAPNLKLITFIDDIFGEKDVCKKDVQEWNKRISNIKTLFLDEQTETNFLLITVRNEVFNSLEKRSVGTIFTKDNLIDLSSETYKVEEEKKRLLELYTPENFSWTDHEKDKILTYAPNIGFPQCCQLFYNSEELQKERVRFFENPFHFLNEVLLRLQECSALLFLFLNNCMIRVKDLDRNIHKVNQKLLEQAFSIKLIAGKKDSTILTNKKKLGFVKESLDKLLGFLVVKEKHWSGEDVYRFNDDHIYVAVALLYGKVTPIGYIQNCPSKSLSYLTTSDTATNMIVISSYHYTEMCERLLREFECEENRYDTSIGSLDVWNDPVFVKTFVRYLNDRKVDKLPVLNKACSSGAEDCALYLLSEGVKPDKDTALSLVTSRHWNDSNRQVYLLQKIVVYLNDETKLDVLNKACSSGAGECVLYLLFEGVAPDKNTVMCVEEGGSEKVKKNVLHMACLHKREEMVTLLCDSYPHLVHDTDDRWGRTPLHIVMWRGNCSMFQTLERCVLNSLYRVEDQQHKCESVDGRVVHRNCVCAQYMAQLVDDEGRTVLHWSCVRRNREVCLYVCQSYPALTTAVDKDGCHCLHDIAVHTSDVDMFTECESHVKQYLESTGRKYDITTILDNKGKSVLDKVKERRIKNNPLLDHLINVFGK